MESSFYKKMSSISHFELPVLPNNIPFECHPEYMEISQEVDDWLVENIPNLKKDTVFESRIGLFSCMIQPDARKERVILAAKHVWIVFLLDDLMEFSSREEIHKIISTAWDMANGVFDRTETNLVLVLYNELMKEIRKSMSASMLSRYLKSFRIYLDGVRSQVQYAHSDKIPTPEEYIILRRQTGFCEIATGIMTEFAMEAELKHEFVQLPEFKELGTAIDDHITLVNDLMSFRKEFYENICHNWVTVLYYHRKDGSGFQETVNKMCKKIQEEEDKILKLQKKMINKAVYLNDGEALRFIRAWPYAASGNLRWSYISGRYHGEKNPFLTGEAFHGTWLLHPKATVVAPLYKVDNQHPYMRLYK